MKYRFLPLLLLSLLFVRCQQPPVILSTESAFTLNDGSGFSGFTNFIYFKSKAVGTQTEITFSNDDGDYVKLRFTSLHTGNYTLAQLIDVKLALVNAAGGAANLTATEGFVNVTSASGSGAGVVAFGGSFQFNVETNAESEEDVGPPGEVGTVKGVFNYTATTTAPQ